MFAALGITAFLPAPLARGEHTLHELDSAVCDIALSADDFRVKCIREHSLQGIRPTKRLSACRICARVGFLARMPAGVSVSVVPPGEGTVAA